MVTIAEYLPFEHSAVILGLFLMVYLLVTRSIRKTHTLIYLLMVAITMVSAVSSIMSWDMELTGVINDNLLAAHLCEMVYFTLHSSLGYLFAIYIMLVNGSYHIHSLRWKVLFAVPIIVCEILVITNPLHQFVYYFNEAGQYSRGNQEIWLYLISAFYIIFALCNLIRYREALPTSQEAVLFFFFLAGAVGLGIQFADQHLKTELFAEMMAFLGILIVIENTEGNRDPISNALSRATLITDVTRMVETGLHFQLILIRITNLDLYARILSNDDYNGVLQRVEGYLEELLFTPEVYYPRRGVFVISYPTDKDIAETLETLRSRVAEPWHYKDMTVEFEAVLAHLRVPENLTGVDEIFRLIDSEFKKAGTGIQVMEGADFDFLRRRKLIEEVLQNSIKNGYLQTYYQPIWDVEKNRFSTAEALIRLITPELGFVSPAEFIPIAEENGMISDIGRFVFEETCRMYSDAHLDLYGVDYIEVNLSLYQFLHSGLKDGFDKILKEQALTPDRINLEITESADLEQADIFVESMKDLQDYGFAFSLDDFGTGFSNLSDAMRRNFKNIKMDISLLREADQDVNSRLLLSNLIWSFKSMGYHVVQEGVENQDQLDFVSKAGADLIQGFHFSKPLPKADYVAFVQHAYETAEKQEQEKKGIWEF